MINYFHVFIFIMSLALLRTLFLTNKTHKQIFSISLIILTSTLLVLIIGLNVLQPISKLIDLSPDREEVRVSLTSFNYGYYDELNKDERDLTLYKSILEDYEVSYTLKLPKDFLSTSEDLLSVHIGYEFGNRYFVVLSNNVLYYDNKFYRVKNKDLFNDLLELIKDNNSDDSNNLNKYHFN